MSYASSPAGAGGATTFEQELFERFRDSLARPALTPQLEYWGRWVQVSCLLQFGEKPVLLVVQNGSLNITDPLPLQCPWDFAVRGTVQAWTALWEPVPAAGWHDLFALCKRGQMRVEGNLQPLMANLQYFKAVFVLPRTGAKR